MTHGSILVSFFKLAERKVGLRETVRNKITPNQTKPHQSKPNQAKPTQTKTPKNPKSKTYKQTNKSPITSRYLRKTLLEVVVQDVRLLRHDRKGDIVSHAERTLLAALGHVGNLFPTHGKGVEKSPEARRGEREARGWEEAGGRGGGRGGGAVARPTRKLM